MTAHTRMFALAVSLLILSGCASVGVGTSGAASASTGSRSSNGATPLSVKGLTDATVIPLTASFHYANEGATLDPPGTATATVDSATAYATCLTGDSICEPGVSPTIELARVTDTNVGNAASDGSLTPLLKDTLSWVITYQGIPCAPAGHPASTSSNFPTATSTTCTAVNFISGKDGRVVYSFQSPSP